MLDQEIAEFGRRMGMPTLTLNREGMLALDVDRMGRLNLEKNGEELLVYLTLPCPAHDNDAPARVLSACHYRHNYPFPLSGGVFKDNYLLLTRLSERMVTAVAIENAVKFLASIIEKVAQ